MFLDHLSPELFQKLHLLIYGSPLTHNVIIILVSSDHLNLETVGKKEKIQKIEYLKNKKSFLDEIKSIFHNF